MSINKPDNWLEYDNLDDYRDARTNSQKFTQLMKQTNELKLKFDLFNDNLKLPRLYLSNYFSDVKNKVDLVFNKNILENSSDLAIKEQLQKNYSEIIEYIESFENECLAKHNSKRVKQDTPDTTNERVESLERDLNNLHKKIEIELNKWLKYEKPHNDSDSETESDPCFESYWHLIDDMIKDFNKSIDQFYKQIEVERLELNRKLFLHKTIVFISRHDIPNHYNTPNNIIFKQRYESTVLNK